MTKNNHSIMIQICTVILGLVIFSYRNADSYKMRDMTDRSKVYPWMKTWYPQLSCFQKLKPGSATKGYQFDTHLGNKTYAKISIIVLFIIQVYQFM